MKESKSWQRFNGKIRNLKQYLQLMDLTLKISNSQCIKQKNVNLKICDALGASTQSHKQLNIPNTTNEIRRVYVSTRKSLNEQAFVELHCIFSDYISHIISEIAHNDPKKLLGIMGDSSERTICYADIVKLGNYELIINEMATKVFRFLENLRSTSKMLEKLCKITKISIKESLKNEASIYVDVRHLIIHGDSIVDENFIKRDVHKLIPLKGNKLALKYEVTDKAINKIYEFCKVLDDALIEKGVLPIRK